MSEYLTADDIIAAKPHGFDALLRVFRKPVNPALIKQKPGKGNASYIPHHTLRQYLHLAFDDASIQTLEVIDKGDGQYGVRCMLCCRLGDEYRTFHGWGESDNRDYPLKSAESDAFKRICGMELGLGLHLWAQQTYFLDKVADLNLAAPASPSAAAATPGADVPPAAPGADVQGEPPASDADAGEGEAPASAEEPARLITEELDATEQVDEGYLTRKFMAVVGDVGLDYEEDVRPFLVAKKGESWSKLAPTVRQQIADWAASNPQAFAEKVREWHQAAA